MYERDSGMLLLLCLCLLLLVAPMTGAIAAADDNSASHWEWTLSFEEYYVSDHTTAPDGDHAYVLLRTSLPEFQDAVVMKLSADGSVVWRESYDPPVNGIAELTAHDSQLVVEAENTDTDAAHTTVFTTAGEIAWADARQLGASALIDSGYLRVTDDEAPTVQQIHYGNGVQWETEEFDSVSYLTSAGEQTLVVGRPKDGRSLANSQPRLFQYSSDGTMRATSQFEELPDVQHIHRWKGNILVRSWDMIYMFGPDLTRRATISGVSEYVTTDLGTFILTEAGDVVKLTGDGATAWHQEGVIGQNAADRIEYEPQTGQVYISGGASVEQESVAEFNTTAIAALNAETGEVKFNQWVVHPDLGDSFDTVRKADDGSYLVSASGFGIAKLSPTGNVRWHISEDDGILVGPENTSTERGRLEYRTTLEHRDFARHPEGYVFITDGTATIVQPDGDLVASDEFADEPAEMSSIDGGYLFEISADSIGLLADPAAIDAASIHDDRGLLPTIASLFEASPPPAPQPPTVASPGANLSTVSFETGSVAPSSPSSGFVAALSAFLRQMFSVQSLVILGAAVIAVLIVRTWPDDH